MAEVELVVGQVVRIVIVMAGAEQPGHAGVFAWRIGRIARIDGNWFTADVLDGPIPPGSVLRYRIDPGIEDGTHYTTWWEEAGLLDRLTWET